MLKIIFQAILILAGTAAYAQGDFIGIAKYKMTEVGGDENQADSMAVVFDKKRLLITLYIQDPQVAGKFRERVFYEDFENKVTYVINRENKTYKQDSLNTENNYDFSENGKQVMVKNHKCAHYKADPEFLDKSAMTNAELLGGIDYPCTYIKNYVFSGFQPIIVDEKVVLDFIITQPDGVMPRIYVSLIYRMPDVSSFFDLSEYKLVK